MAKFKEAFDYMMKNEDAQQNGKIIRDAGGVTKYGVSFNFLKKLGLDHADLNHDGVVDEEDIIEMTFDQSRDQIYEPYFWKPIQGDAIKQQAVANKLLDMAVNMGAGQATHILQRSLYAVGRKEITEDGNFGAKTLAAVNAIDHEEMLKNLRLFSIAFYEHIATVRPVSRAEYMSWRRRALA